MRKTAELGLLVLLAVLWVFPFAGTAQEDPVIVRVGKVEYPLSLARYSYQSNIDLLSYQGITPTAEEKQKLISETVDHMVELGLIENKLMEAGQNDLTPNEETMLRSYAGNLYESLWQGFQERVKKRRN